MSHPSSFPGLWVLAPLLIPLPALGWVRAFNGWLFRTVARACAWRLGFRDPVLINYVPVLAGAMRGWRRTVYHCVDRWDQFDMYDTRLMVEMDRRCRARAPLVIASSTELERYCRRDHANVHLVSHGVDYGHFSKALHRHDAVRPADLPSGPLIGFIGLLSEWVDQGLIVALARAIPEAHVVLIGKADVPIEALRAEPNIHVLGPRPFVALPDYLAHVAVGIIPFVVSELTRAVNPVKLREMLAAGCRVVSTALPEVARYASGPGVVVADSHADFLSAVRQRVAEPLTTAERAALSTTMREETWANKVSEILALIEGQSRWT